MSFAEAVAVDNGTPVIEFAHSVSVSVSDDVIIIAFAGTNT
jgi:hypothetical protein